MNDDQYLKDIIAAVRAHNVKDVAQEVPEVSNNALMDVLQSPHVGDLFGMVLTDAEFKNIMVDIFAHRGDHESAPGDQKIGHIIGRIAPSLAAAFGDIAGEEFKDIAADAIQHMGPIVAQAITDDDGQWSGGSGGSFHQIISIYLTLDILLIRAPVFYIFFGCYIFKITMMLNFKNIATKKKWAIQ